MQTLDFVFLHGACQPAHTFLHFKILKCVCRLTSTAQKTKSWIYIDTLYYIKVQQHDHSVFLYVCYLDSIILDPRPLFKKPIISKKSFRCLIDKIQEKTSHVDRHRQALVPMYCPQWSHTKVVFLFFLVSEFSSDHKKLC